MIKISRHFIFYSLIGVSGVLLDCVAFYFLHEHLGLHYQGANFLSTSIGISNNFIWNAFLNFKITDSLLLRYVRFYSVGLLGLLVSALFLYTCIDVLGLHATGSKLASVVLVVVLQYGLNKKFSFGDAK